MRKFKTFFLTVVLFATSVNLFSRMAEDTFTKPDYEQIKLNVEDSQSNFYYPKLWDRFQQGDNTLTIEEKRHLYYGYVFHVNYSPYSTVRNFEQVNSILGKENPTQQEWEELVALLNASLKAEPFDVKFLLNQAIAYDKLNKPVEANINRAKVPIILDALFSTGNGLTEETAIHIIAVYSEYNVLLLNRFSLQSQQTVGENYDVLTLQSNSAGIKELWFDVSQPRNYLKKSFK